MLRQSGCLENEEEVEDEKQKKKIIQSRQQPDSARDCLPRLIVIKHLKFGHDHFHNIPNRFPAYYPTNSCWQLH
jgi:hypothetical protein